MIKKNPISLHLLTLLTFFGILPEINAQINFSNKAEYSYLKGSKASALSSSWVNNDYNDSNWLKGTAPFWYGDGEGGTPLPDMQGAYSTLYLRTTFQASNVANLGDISFYVNYDDGFALWINGKEVLTKNAPADKTFNSFASTPHESGTSEKFSVYIGNVPLQEGLNTVAVQCFNVNLESSDLHFDMSMEAEVELPEMVDTVDFTFSHPAGFYNTPFNLTVSASDPNASILYTLDGSNPRTSSSVLTAGSTATFHIDPTKAEHRPTTPAFLLRVSAKKEGYKPSIPETKTFIFIEQIKSQGHPGGQWPEGIVNNQLIDLGVDSRVVNDTRYKDQINSAFTDIPSLSVVTDLENLFDPVTGIYVNPQSRGDQWERPTSVELLNPNGTEGFQVNAGIRIRGGYSRRPEVTKHSFRLLFRKQYGNGKLHFPWFGNEGAPEFDKMDLRTAQNHSWHEGSHQYTFLRDVFSRDTQRDMEQPYTRSRYYHLYLNGMYWGIYQTQERVDDSFAESYLGDQEENYDVIKVTSENNYYVKATDGTMDAWEHIYELTKTGFTNDANYFYLEGKDSNGKPVKGAETLVDIDNLIDYMLVIFYSGNLDAPSSQFMQNKRANNFYGVFNRKDKTKGFTFFAHDSEWSMFDLYENRVNIGSRNDFLKMEVNELNVFHPQWLHFKLSENAEYRQRFADRAYKHFRESGPLTPEKAIARLDKRIQELEMAVIGESARWGDSKPNTSFNKIDHWIPEINYLRDNYLMNRTQIVVSQLEAASLFSPLSPPIVKTAEEIIEQENYPLISPIQLHFEKRQLTGDIYYTFNGEDPRLPGGGISDNAIKLISESKTFEIAVSTKIKARTFHNGGWSALKQVNFLSEKEDFTHLKVTELHYHPKDIISGQDTIFGKDYEFIEFKNTGEKSINLTGLWIDGGISFTFPENSLLEPNHFFVIASKPPQFYEAYGLAASGNFQGNLSNAGENIILKNSEGTVVLHLSYNDKSPWPEKADGNGYSLVSSIPNPSDQPNFLSYWRASNAIGGTPFEDDPEVLGVLDSKAVAENFIVFPNPTTKELNIAISHAKRYKEDCMVTLITAGGKKVHQALIHQKGKIDFKALGIEGGLYVLKISSGNHVHTSKIIYIP